MICAIPTRELVTISICAVFRVHLQSVRENWLFSAIPSETFWIGLNSRQQESIWIWSNGKSAAKELDWLSVTGNPSGRCAGIQPAPRSILKFNCENKYRWLCKKAESPNIFDVFLSQYLSRPFSSQKIYSSLHSAKTDCLYDRNCTGVVKVSQYFRRMAGIDEIHFAPFTAPSSAISYVKRGMCHTPSTNLLQVQKNESHVVNCINFSPILPHQSMVVKAS
nr:uncharacterized protein LOC116837252 isoform X2 [Chelonoidis abingdonii]